MGIQSVENYREQETERQAIARTLNLAVKVFGECNANYRILGSTLIVAHSGRVFRHIGDLDVLLDEGSTVCVFGRLENAGFALQKKRKAGFSWIEATKEGCLGFTFLLIGKFPEDYFSWQFLKVCELRISSSYLVPTPYSFEGVNFIGIPLSSVIAGIRQSFLNPKRKIDKKVLEKEMQEVKVKAYGNIQVHVFGIRVPFLYDIFSFLYNMYGGMRVLLGKKYEIWD